jgi:peroxiredoxin
VARGCTAEACDFRDHHQELLDAGAVRVLGLSTFQAGSLTLFKLITLIVKDDRIEHAFYPIYPPREHARQVLAWLHATG